MSKLDYVTIAIVGICILAIVFLVYKMTNVFNGDASKENTEISADSVETEDDSVYDYEIDNNVDSTGETASGNTTTGGSTTTQPSTTAVPADKTGTSASSAPAEDDAPTGGSSTAGSTSSSGSGATDSAPKTNYSEGKYMVLAGSFTKRALADAQVNKLDKMGYDNARVELFDRGKYAVVLVDRFSTMAEAERLVKKLSGDGVKSYVKAKS